MTVIKARAFVREINSKRADHVYGEKSVAELFFNLRYPDEPSRSYR